MSASKLLILAGCIVVGCACSQRQSTPKPGQQGKLGIYPESINTELFQIFQEDQADRKLMLVDPPQVEIGHRDERRRARVQHLLDSGGAQASEDYFYAAIVFQHGKTVEDFRRAHELALKAVEIDPGNKRARWLAAASKDRELMTLGMRQLYGTQGPYQVDPIVTDEERAKWNVPPLEETRKRAGL